MSDTRLADLWVLVVEDEYFLADDLCSTLAASGAEIVGPVGGLSEATALVRGDAHIDVACLDIDLRGEPVFPLADLLVERGIPFVFNTGYEESVIPERFREIPRCEKPVDVRRLLATLRGAVTPPPPSGAGAMASRDRA